VKVYEVLMRVEAADGINEEQVREEIYDACPDVNFGFDIETVAQKMASLIEVDQFAEKAHEGQMDKGGVPYIEHVRAVAAGLEPFSTRLQMAGLLHDVIEDTEWTAEGLRGAGIESRVVRIVELVSKVPGENYMDRICKISQDREATLLKIADNAHNSRVDRAAKLPDGNAGRLARYGKAREILWKAVEPFEVAQILEIVNPDLLGDLQQMVDGEAW
jgi:(p)ppGpp synthase/HD superfamily hydrolase